MGLESASYISQLSAANPLASDPLGQADDHIRLIKSVLKTTFPNITGAVTATQEALNRTWVPIGTIVMWNPNAGAIPSGWGLCDGSVYVRSDGAGNITAPDLRDRFVVGSGSSYTAGTTGGSLSTSTVAGHNHGGTTGGTTLTTDQLPAHTHTGTTGTDGAHTHTGDFSYLIGGTGFGSGGTAQLGSPVINSGGSHSHTFTTNATGGGATHSHTLSSDGSHNHTILPPYYAIAFIMRY